MPLSLFGPSRCSGPSVNPLSQFRCFFTIPRRGGKLLIHLIHLEKIRLVDICLFLAKIKKMIDYSASLLSFLSTLVVLVTFSENNVNYILHRRGNPRRILDPIWRCFLG